MYLYVCERPDFLTTTLAFPTPLLIVAVDDTLTRATRHDGRSNNLEIRNLRVFPIIPEEGEGNGWVKGPGTVPR